MDRLHASVDVEIASQSKKRRKRLPQSLALAIAIICPACSFSQESQTVSAPSRPAVRDEITQADEPGLFDSLLNGKKLRNERLDDVVRGADGNFRSRSTSAKQLELIKSEFNLADQLFEKKEYKSAGKKYHSLAKKYEDTPLEEEALFKEGECYFSLQQLPAAEEAYAKLLKKYINTRYTPQAVERLYSIATYWLDDARLEANKEKAKTSRFTRMVNFFDKTRPTFDTEGRALKTIETIAQHEPSGPIADDAIMLAGAYKFSQENPDKYFLAANDYEQVVLNQPKSEHADKAYFLGVQAYLKSYRGTQYDPSELNKAEQLAKAALARKSLTGEQRTKLEQDLKDIEMQRAERDFARGQDYVNMRRRNAARFYFGQVVSKYPETEWAKKAKVELQKLGGPEPEYEPGLLGELSKKTLAEHFRQKRQSEKTAAKKSPQTTIEKIDPSTNVMLPKPPGDGPATEGASSESRSNLR